MPRPSRNLTRISVYLPADALTGLDVKAARLTAPEARYRVTRSDVIRLAVEDYLRRDAEHAPLWLPQPKVSGLATDFGALPTTPRPLRQPEHVDHDHL